MVNTKVTGRLRCWRLRLLLSAAILLTGCIGGAGDEDDGIPVTGAQPGEITLSGSVGDGPIVGAKVSVRDARGEVIASGISDAGANYSINVPALGSYPLLLTAEEGIDLVTQAAPGFVMASAVTSGAGTANINPFTTLIVKTAQSMSGGLTAQNLQSARAIVLVEFNFGFDTALSPDPITTPVTAANVANIVKSSEALGEMIRRIRLALLVPGMDYSEDHIVDLLAADLGTGTLNGSGTGTDPRVSATARIVSAQVLIESLRNELAVDGTNATARMDAAITATMPDALARTGEVAVTSEMIQQVRDMIASVNALLPSEGLDALAEAADLLKPGDLPATVRGIIPAGASGLLGEAIAHVVTASEQALQDVNQSPAAPAIPPPGESPAGLSISNTTPLAYQWDSLAIGKLAYIDRAFTYTDIPSAFAGYHVLRTRNEDKGTTGNSFVQFTVSNAVAVYVARDTRITSLPSWLDGWADTGELLTTGDTALRVYRKEFPAGNIALGGNQGGASHSMYTVLVAALQGEAGGNMPPGDQGEGGDGTGGTGNDGGNVFPVAVSDTASTPMNTAITIDVLANDQGLSDAPIAVSVISSPSNGQTQVTQANRIRYTPNQGFAGTDTFNYRVQDADGDFSTASVSVSVTCGQCAHGVSIRYSWNPSPGQVSGYKIYYGQTKNTASQQISDIPIGTAGFNALSPSVTYGAWNDLGLDVGQPVCLRVKAYNAAGDSGYSEGVCGVIPQ